MLRRMLWRAFPPFLFVFLAACSSPSWPDERFPAELEIEQTLFSEARGIFMEGCEAIVVELKRGSVDRLIASNAMHKGGWRQTPLVLADGEHLFADAAMQGCNDSGRRPVGDLESALQHPGSHYKLVNGGEGLAVIVPRAKLAGWFYVG